MLDHTPIVIDKFMGLFDRGENDSCPIDHFTDCLNVYFKESAVARRPKFQDTSTVLSNIRRIRPWQKAGVPRLLVLTNNFLGGTTDLYDVTVSLVTPLITFTFSSIDDFQVVNEFDRAYIIFQETTEASVAKGLHVYDGTTVRAAAGAGPSTALAAATSATAGNIAAGEHAIAFAFETPSGFITPPSSQIVYTAPGLFKVDLTSIDTGPSGTVKRHILATRSYNSTLEPTPEFFFAAEVAGNVATTATIDFNDLELSDSADYLFDLFDAVASGQFITKYRGRLVIGGLIANRSYVLFSKVGQPEAFDQVEGYLSVDPDDGGYVYNGLEYRGSFLMFKDPGVYSTIDNGQEPVFWEINKLDSGVGTRRNGISTIISSKGTTNDTVVVATRNGISLFNGIFNQPELSWKISSYYDSRLNFAKFYKFQVVNDPVTKRIYIGTVLSGSTEIDSIIVGDYSLGLDPTNIRWTLWSLGVSIYGFALDTDPTSGTPIFLVATSSVVKQLVASATESSGVQAFVKTAYLTPTENGSVCHYAGVRYRVSGSGSFTTTLSPLDNVGQSTLGPINLASSPAKEILRWANVINERVAITFGQATVDTGDFLVRKLELFAKILWVNRFNE